MNVLLTHGYFLQEDPKEQAIMKPYPPLGILYLSAWLDRHGVENEVFDTTFSSPARLQQYLLNHRPRIVALYTNLMTKINVIAIIRFIRAQQTLQHTLIVLGGPDVTHNAADYLSTGADLIVIGEGEQTMLEIIEFEVRSLKFEVRSLKFEDRSSKFEVRTSNFELQTSNFKLQTSNYSGIGLFVARWFPAPHGAPPKIARTGRTSLAQPAKNRPATIPRRLEKNARP